MREGKKAAVPILAMTADAFREDVEKAARANFLKSRKLGVAFSGGLSYTSPKKHN